MRRETPSATATSSSGIGFCGLLTIVFVIAKITGYIDWSWWWVFSPLWISFLVVGTLFAVIYLIIFIMEMKK